MVVAVLGPVSVWFCFCHQSKRSSVGDVVVLSPSLLVSLAARIRRSAGVSLELALEVEDDKWGPFVSDSVFKWNFSIFRFE